MKRLNVAIVGCGVAGTTAALLLARNGHRATLFEQSPQVGPVGAGILLQPSGQAVLAKLGWLDRVLARAAPLEELYARHADGGELIRTRYPEFEPGCLAYGVHRGVLFGAVRDAVRSQPVDVRLTCRVVDRSVERDGVYLTDSCGHRYGPFDFVLAGDGARSSLRAACGFKAHVTRYAHGTLWINAPGTSVQGRLLQVVRGNGKLFGLLPLGDGLSSLYWGLPTREFPRLKARGLPALKQEVLKFAPEAAEVLDFVHDFDQLLLTAYQHVWMPRWFDRHTLFLGDSAHAMSPHLGQGINLALLDAARLADCLRMAPDPYTGFCAFRRARRAHVRCYATITYLLSPFFQSDWPILGWGRDVFLPLMPRVPWMKRQMLLTVSGLRAGFLGGRVAV
jgi:2-polyprenyl-6-methoxyphenol hydroxylase-like FAD-dependent oxidoreductase